MYIKILFGLCKDKRINIFICTHIYFTPLYIYICVCVCVCVCVCFYSIPPKQTRSIFKKVLDFNSEFSFSKTGCHDHPAMTALIFTHKWRNMKKWTLSSVLTQSETQKSRPGFELELPNSFLWTIIVKQCAFLDM